MIALFGFMFGLLSRFGFLYGFGCQLWFCARCLNIRDEELGAVDYSVFALI
tara:strand:+ start:419 stop:571 length:153 start_codon:yes stop_codon:yes gene_type:complete